MKVFFREWFVVFCLLCFIVVLFFVEVFAPDPVVSLCEPGIISKIQVIVAGAVDRPGMYEVSVGTSVQSVLFQAGLKKTADKNALYLKKKLLHSCSLNVPEKKSKKNKKKKTSSSSIALTSCANLRL